MIHFFGFGESKFSVKIDQEGPTQKKRNESVKFESFLGGQKSNKNAGYKLDDHYPLEPGIDPFSSPPTSPQKQLANINSQTRKIEKMSPTDSLSNQ